MSAEDLPHQARRVDPHAARDADSDPWNRAREENVAIDPDAPGDLSVRVGDGDVHDVRIVEDRHGFVAACDCDGFAFHEDELAGDACAHVLAVCQEAALDSGLVAEVEGEIVLDGLDDEADVVEHDQDDDDQETSADPQEGRPDHAAPPTPSAGDAPTVDEEDVEDLDEFVTEVAGVPSVFVVDMGRGKSSKPYVTKEGLNYIARKAGIQTRAEEISPSWEEPTDVAAYRAIAVDDEGRRYEDVATAHAGEVENTVGRENLDELASTRATNRALRLATGCGFASVEELDETRALEGDVVDAEAERARADGGSS